MIVPTTYSLVCNADFYSHFPDFVGLSSLDCHYCCLSMECVGSLYLVVSTETMGEAISHTLSSGSSLHSIGLGKVLRRAYWSPSFLSFAEMDVQRTWSAM